MVDTGAFEYMEGAKVGKPLAFCVKKKYFEELEKYKDERQKGKERFGRKAFIRQTKTLIQNCMVEKNARKDKEDINKKRPLRIFKFQDFLEEM